jgi:hypothetical protein
MAAGAKTRVLVPALLVGLLALWIGVAYFGEVLIYAVAARSLTAGRPVSELVREAHRDTAGRVVYSLVEAAGMPIAALHEVDSCVLPLTAQVALRGDQWSGNAHRQADTSSIRCAAGKLRPATPGVLGQGRFARRADTLKLFSWPVGSAVPDTVATATLIRDTLRVRIDSAGGELFVYVRHPVHARGGG